MMKSIHLWIGSKKTQKQRNTLITEVISECLYTGQINRKWEVIVNIHHDQRKLI